MHSGVNVNMTWKELFWKFRPNAENISVLENFLRKQIKQSIDYIPIKYLWRYEYLD